VVARQLLTDPRFSREGAAQPPPGLLDPLVGAPKLAHPAPPAFAGQPKLLRITTQYR
jgi:hypothetical protein